MEQDIRDAAEALRVAILEAEAAGYRINWPPSAAGLATIEISETAAVEPAAATAAAEVPPPATKPPAKAKPTA